MRFTSIMLVLLLTPARTAFAQSDQAPKAPLVISHRAIARGMAEHPPALAQASPRDSLVNGAAIGAMVGAVALGASGAWICQMLREPGDPPCWKGVLRVSVIGAGIGAGAGAGIDALFAKNWITLARQ